MRKHAWLAGMPSFTKNLHHCKHNPSTADTVEQANRTIGDTYIYIYIHTHIYIEIIFAFSCNVTDALQKCTTSHFEVKFLIVYCMC